jgi:hypothetical protein
MSADALRRDGYIFLAKALTREQSLACAQAVERLVLSRGAHEARQTSLTGQLYQALDLWQTLLATTPLMRTLRQITQRLVVLPGIDTVAMDSSETDWHRDSSYSALPSAAGDHDARYCVIRVILYPSVRQDAMNSFWLFPGSHRPGWRKPRDLQTQYHALDVRPEDIVVFDPRIVHAGAPPKGAKRMVVVTFGQDNVLSRETLEHERRQGLPVPANEAWDRYRSFLISAGLWPTWTDGRVTAT